MERPMIVAACFFFAWLLLWGIVAVRASRSMNVCSSSTQASKRTSGRKNLTIP